MARIFSTSMRAGLVAVAMGLAGCNTYHVEAGNSFSAAGIRELGTGAGIPVQVDGIVAGTGGAALTDAVVAAMPASFRGTDIRYMPCAPNSDCAGDRIVFTFGAPTARSAFNYPSELHFYPGWIGTYEPSDENVTVKVALFQNGVVVASASGHTNARTGITDPYFQSLVDSLTSRVFAGPGVRGFIGL